MYLSFSGYKKWGGCNYAYWNSYIGKTDIGPEDRLGSIYGSSIGTIFEDFYNKRWWKLDQPRAAIFGSIDGTVDKIIEDETTDGANSHHKAGVLKWKGDGEGQSPWAMYANIEELKADVRDGVERGIRIIKAERLLGPRADAEVRLDFVLNGEHKLGGRADFIILRTKPHRDLCIIDGKGSRHRDKYVDRRQLFWYALLYFLNVGELPDKLAFLFWRYDPPDSMDWVNFSKDDIDELREDVLTAIRKIERRKARLSASTSFDEARKVFLPIAEDERADSYDVGQACRFCPYGTEEICPKGREVQVALEKKYAKRRRSV